MYLNLILFFIALVGITFILSRKLAIIKKGEIRQPEYAHPFVPDIKKAREILKRKTKKYGYAALFVTLRFYIQASSFLKKKSLELAQKIEKRLLKTELDKESKNGEKREASRYLKMISEYQKKIRDMKHRIRTEEGIE